jgi:hypothetical protein
MNGEARKAEKAPLHTPQVQFSTLGGKEVLEKSRVPISLPHLKPGERKGITASGDKGEGTRS